MYADQQITAALWPNHQLIAGKDTLLRTPPALLQLSCHGSAREAYTGQGDVRMTAFELDDAIETPMRALLTIACSTAQAGTNGFGESGGWSVVLHDKVGAVLGALYPVSDRFCPLFVLLLHRAWAGTGDLRAALAEVRRRLRTGQWVDDETDAEGFKALWVEALRAVPRNGALAGGNIDEYEDAAGRVSSYFEDREFMYDDECYVRLIAEAFVIFG